MQQQSTFAAFAPPTGTAVFFSPGCQHLTEWHRDLPPPGILPSPTPRLQSCTRLLSYVRVCLGDFFLPWGHLFLPGCSFLMPSLVPSLPYGFPLSLVLLNKTLSSFPCPWTNSCTGKSFTVTALLASALAHTIRSNLYSQHDHGYSPNPAQ